MILSEVKQAIIGYEDDEAFDNELAIHIDMAFSYLVENDIVIQSSSYYMEEFENIINPKLPEFLVHQIRSYIITQVKLTFDPPNNKHSQDILVNTVNQLLHRLTKYV